MSTKVKNSTDVQHDAKLPVSRSLVEQRIAKAWTWLAKQEDIRCYDERLGDCFKAHAVLIALKMVAEDCG